MRRSWFHRKPHVKQGLSTITIKTNIIKNFLLQKESRLDSLLHQRARSGDVVGLRHVLESGRVHPDCVDEADFCYLMFSPSKYHFTGWNDSAHAGLKLRQPAGGQSAAV